MLPDLNHENRLSTPELVGHLVCSIEAIDSRVDELRLIFNNQKLVTSDGDDYLVERMKRLKETKKCLQESLFMMKDIFFKDYYGKGKSISEGQNSMSHALSSRGIQEDKSQSQ